ncbi:MAG: DUF819 family protein [Bacteroidales bacterium]|nr:DUF819 family protein [Bacteroidales bacterium]
MAKSAFLSMIIAVISMIIMIIAGYFIFRNSIPEANKVAGMLSGIYTGGTPNLAALKAALNVSEDVYIAVNTVDIFIGAFYVLFLISFAKKLFSKVLPPYPYPIAEQVSTEEKRVIKRLKVWVKHVSLPNILAAFGVSILIAAIGAGTGFSITKNPAYQMAITILIITTLAIVASNITLVKKIRGSFDIGMYLILIFSIAVASMADFSNITRSVLPLIGYISIATFGTMIMHLIGCRIFKIDADTMMVTSAALICSPPFVPVVCGAIKNKDVMVSGITIGVIGYAIGNYIGVLIAWLL